MSAMIAKRTDPCVCEHPPLVHRGVIVSIDGHPKADYATLLGSCGSCSCPRYEPRSGSTAPPAASHEETRRRCPVCGSPEPMFARNLYRKGEFWGVCSSVFHPSRAASPGRPAPSHEETR